MKNNTYDYSKTFQRKLFLESLNYNYNSIEFITVFLKSKICSIVDENHTTYTFHNPNYIINLLEEEGKLKIRRNPTKIDPNIIEWIAYFYREANRITEISSRKLLKIIPAKKLGSYYYSYHTLDIQILLDDLRIIS